MTIKRPPVIATILAAVAIAILCTLGIWQVQRLEWKRNLLASIDVAYASPPDQAVLTPGDIESAGNDKGSLLFLRGTIYGEYMNDKSIRVIPRTHNGAQGFHLITPFRLGNGTILLVNRGWAPNNVRESDLNLNHGKVKQSGLIRYPDRGNFFTPANNPRENIWYTVDIESIAQYLEIDGRIMPFVFYTETGTEAGYPVAVGQKPAPNNNHLSYALFWFGMAGVLIVIFILRFVIDYRSPPAGAISL